MRLSIEDSNCGVAYWLGVKSKWPRDFHNAVYHQLFSTRKDGLSKPWWDATVDRLWEWKAIRPESKNEINERCRRQKTMLLQ